MVLDRLELVAYTIPLSYRLLRTCVGPLVVVWFTRLGSVLTICLANLILCPLSLLCSILRPITGCRCLLVKQSTGLAYLLALTPIGLRNGLKQYALPHLLGVDLKHLVFVLRTRVRVVLKVCVVRGAGDVSFICLTLRQLPF